MPVNTVRLDAMGSKPAKAVSLMQEQAKRFVYKSTLREASYAERMAKRIIACKGNIVSMADVIGMARNYQVAERYIPWVIVEFKRQTGMVI